MLSHYIVQLYISYMALIAHTFSSLWEQRQTPFILPLITLWTCRGPSALTGDKTKTPNNFPLCPDPDGRRGTFFHTPLQHTYVYTHHNNEWSPQTFSHSEQDESVNRTCFSGEHIATRSGSSRQRGGQIRKDSRLKRQLRRCHYACLPSKGPYPPPRRQKQCLLFYLATGV